MYPSIDAGFASEKVAEMFLESAVVVDKGSIDKRELGLYLALNRIPAELPALGLEIFCQKSWHRKGKPLITGCAERRVRREIQTIGKPLGGTR